jgi:hypothetical protein
MWRLALVLILAALGLSGQTHAQSVAPCRWIAYGVDDRLPAWSPHGTQLAFSRAHVGNGGCERSSVYLTDASGHDPRKLTSGAFDDLSPTWSHDGRLIAFERDEVRGAKAPNIFVVRAAGGGLRKLEPGAIASLDPAWSVRGRLAFVARMNGQSGIDVASPDGRNPRLLFETAPFTDDGANWSAPAPKSSRMVSRWQDAGLRPIGRGSMRFPARVGPRAGWRGVTHQPGRRTRPESRIASVESWRSCRPGGRRLSTSSVGRRPQPARRVGRLTERALGSL